MRNKHSRGFVLCLCILSAAWFLGLTGLAKAEPPEESSNFQLLGSVDTADDGTPAKSRAYSKIAPWPDTESTFLNTGCYESSISAGSVGCFRVVDVSDPKNPKRIATVEVFDRVQSPRPPGPDDPYWTGKDEYNVWKNDKFNNLPFSTACGDWKVDASGKHSGPGWHDTPGEATCWDKGWITRTHFTAGASGDFQKPGRGYGSGSNKKSSIYWVNSQRQFDAPAKRLGYTGIAFYDLKDPQRPEFLSRIDMQAGRSADGAYTNAGGVHHGFFDGRYAYLGAAEDGYIGEHLVIVDAKDPRNPKIVGRWWVPGQKTPEEDDIRNSTAIDPQTGLMKGWKLGGSFAPIKIDPSGLLVKDVSFHYIDLRRIRGKDIAFIAWHGAGLIILDLTDKSRPKFLSRFDYLTPAFQANDTLPGAKSVHDKCVEVNGPDTACGNAHSAKLVPGTNTLWMSDEYFALPYGHLRFFDVSDLKKPKLLSHFYFEDYTLNRPASYYPKRTASTHLGNTWGKNLLFLAWYGLGVKAVNFADPRKPYLAGSYSYSIKDGKGGQATYDVVFDPKGNLCVSDSNDGVRILRYTGPK